MISNNVKLIGYKKLNLNYCDLLYLKENRFLYEKYIKFNLFPESNLFFQYKKIYKQFFFYLFLNEKSCVKALFIKTYPVLKEIYFINKDLLEYIFEEKIHPYNFKNESFVGQTEQSNLNIYVKENFEGNEDKIEVEICFFAALIIILIHEFCHFIRIYIYKHLGLIEYKNSFDFDDEIESDIGYFIEKNLFGKIIEKITIKEVYILNIKNYLKNKKEFLKGFINLSKHENINLNQIDEQVIIILTSLNIDITNIKRIEKDSEIIIKGVKSSVSIGKNNDKLYFPQAFEKIIWDLSNNKNKLKNK